MTNWQALSLLLSAGLVACTAVEPASESSKVGTAPAEPDVLADLRADSNRDGEIRFDDDSDAEKRAWNGKTGAVFLANIDDDSERCKVRANAGDLDIAECNDAQDEIVNGAADALDLARLKSRPWPKTPDDATAHVEVVTTSAKPFVRLFKRVGPEDTDFEPLEDDNEFTAEEIREGIELAIEGKDILRDRSTWDGYVDVQLTVTSSEGESTDLVKLRLAPVLTSHHLSPAETIWVSTMDDPGNEAMRDDLTTSCNAAGLGTPRTIDDGDLWTQDFFETGYMSMPGKGGEQHVMRVNYRSANVYEPGSKKNPLRPAGRLVFELRGRDVAGVQQFDIEHDGNMDTLNSFGNFETIPPYEKDGVSYPLGRVFRGSTKSYYPDESFTRMIEAQQVQPPVYADTSWLLVAHIDETLSFVKAPTKRGWVVLANDARLAKTMLEEQVAAGNGNVPMFVGKYWFDWDTGQERPAVVTIREVLQNAEVMQASAEAAAEVDAQLAVLKEEVGITDDEIIRVPFLHMVIDGKSIAYQPATVNGVYIADDRFGAPDPHGPLINGKDIFKTALSEPLAKLGIAVDYIEDWDAYHINMGEVHCGTNATRAIPEARWWESGR